MLKGRPKPRCDDDDDDDDDGDEEAGYAETDPSGRYSRSDEVLGRGAMKTVYRAIDEVLGMEVAWSQVKLIDLLQSPDDLQRLYSEVHLLSTFNHDSIIRFYTSWIDVDRRTFNFITEMFTSGTLREYRKRYKKINIRAIKIWALQILEGLVYLHGHDPQVIHRDLKCDNIFINGHLGQVKIGDLGFAAILHGASTAHSVIGTPEFMAPELYEENYNQLVDVYSFGMCVLEMLTSEYPYSECTNPAQIYKKGKLPRAFYKVKDLEAQRFIGKCLATASKRLSAKELILDPFLAMDEDELLSITKVGSQKPILNENIGIEELHLNYNPSRTKMTMTGKLNPDDDNIFLKVQIADKEGSVRNVYFPFDIISDTPINVATEMVKDLEMTDWEPYEIADMIEEELSALVPHWKRWGQRNSDQYRILNYQEDDGDDHQPPFGSFSSCSSPDASLSGLITSNQTGERTRTYYWLQDDLSDDTSSQSSLLSVKYSNFNYCSADEHDSDLGSVKQNQHPVMMSHNSTRLCHVKTCRTTQCIARNGNKLESPGSSTWNDKCASDRRRITRNRSLVDMRSQLLHRSLVEEVNKRRLFKTVGGVESIGFQAPSEVSSNLSRLSRPARLLKTVGNLESVGFQAPYAGCSSKSTRVSQPVHAAAATSVKDGRQET